MTIVEDGTGSDAQSQAEQITLDTQKSFRLLFLGGTESRLGADLVFEAASRAFSDRDDMTLIIACGPGSDDIVDIPWLTKVFDGPNAPDAELIPGTLDNDQLDQLMAQSQALFCLADQARNPEIIKQAIQNDVAIILPEADADEVGLNHQNSYPVMGQTLAAGEGPHSLGVHPQDLAGALRRVMAEPDHVAAKTLLARDSTVFSQQPEEKADTAPTPPDFNLVWGAAAFNYSGYAKVTRTVMSAFDRHDAHWGFHSHGADDRFVEELKNDSAAFKYWERLRNARALDGIYCSFHPPFRMNGQSFFPAIQRENPDFTALASITMFETDRIPTGWAAECNAADEVWVPCQFNIDSFTKGGVNPDKLKKLHLGIDSGPYLLNPRPYEIPGRRSFNFLSIFDWALRKGWDVLLRSYFAAFTADDDVSLTIRAYAAIEEQASIREQIDQFMVREDINPDCAAKLILIEDFVSEAEMPSLYQAADCFVLPSRGEGWGLPYMEAMASGIPTIGTRWSGQMEFMNDANSYLIDLEGLVPVFPEQTRLSAFYESHHLWAQPSACHLKEIMRHVVAKKAEAREIGLRAQEEVTRLWTADHMMQNLYQLAEDLHDRKAREKRAAARKPSANPQGVVPSVAWTGPIYDASGYADEGRNFLHAMDDQNVRVLTFPMNWTTRLAELPEAEDKKLKSLETTALYEGHPAVMVQHTLGEILEPSRAGYPCAGRTMFETDSLPPNWVARCNTLERIWVPSQFNVDTFTHAGVEPHRLRILHPAIDVEQYTDISEPLDFGSNKRVNFLSVFDWTQRKGWDVLIEAWAREFKPEDDVCLVLKVWSSIGKSVQQIYAEIEAYLANKLGIRPDDCAEILIYDHHIAEPDMPRLYAGADAFVLPTRGEGWGRPIMEAMASGVIALATNWGGNTEFMNVQNSLPIDYQMVDCNEAAVAEAAWFQGHRWAECFVPHLQFLMRRVYEGDAIIDQLAARGRQDILTQFDRTSIGHEIRELLIDLSTAR